MKLVQREPETRALFRFLRTRPDRITSVVSTVEVRRAVRRASGTARALRRSDAILARVGLVEFAPSVRTRAAGLEPSILRTLDAIHVASALDLGTDVGEFVTYDERQADAARRLDLDVVSPR